jgi:L-ascorbate metabolism protein UlaG (beta-lactamase superfamily)
MSNSLSITWYGHGTFVLVSPGGKRIVIDPWLTDNPSCPPEHKSIDAADLMLLTHGHPDHIGDAIPVARATGAQIVAPNELGHYLAKKGLQNISRMNIGGTKRLLGLTITMVYAVHSSSIQDEGQLVYLGPATGFVITFENDLTIYFAGDTALFGDMRLIAEIHHPAIAFLPIGDNFTMGPEDAARACDMLGVRQVVPMHYGTNPQLTGTPDVLRRLVEPKGIEVLELKPGETAD